jgi:hypothetical protein
MWFLYVIIADGGWRLLGREETIEDAEDREVHICGARRAWAWRLAGHGSAGRG